MRYKGTVGTPDNYAHIKKLLLMHVSHWDWRTRLRINYDALFKVRALICFRASSGPFSSLALWGPGEHTFLQLGWPPAVYVINHKTSEQAILYKGQQHLLEMITLLLFHLLKFKIAIYKQRLKKQGTASVNSCARTCAHARVVCVRVCVGSACICRLCVYMARGVGTLCVSPKTHHLHIWKGNKGCGCQRIQRRCPHNKKHGGWVSEVSVLGKPPCSHLAVT